MSLSLYVDGDRWRAHLRAVAAAHPGMVPVAKGNGYGFGMGRLARRAQWLGVDVLAVGTYDEAPEALKRFDGDVLVLSPWRPSGQRPPELQTPLQRRVVHTVSRPDDVRALAASASGRHRPRVLLEGRTSMARHGLTPDELHAADTAGLAVEGLALHLPMTGDRVADVERWLGVARGLVGRSHRLADRLFVSHVRDVELTELARRHPEVSLRPRIGTDLWLGAREALAPRATVLDVHAVGRGDRVGYRQRPAPRRGHVLVVSGGTTHGVGLESPTAATSLRSRAVAMARGGLDAAGLALSPFRVAGRQRWFVEPPHMQVSMVFVPDGVVLPAVGDEVGLEVRYTTTRFDRVRVT